MREGKSFGRGPEPLGEIARSLRRWTFLAFAGRAAPRRARLRSFLRCSFGNFDARGGRAQLSNLAFEYGDALAQLLGLGLGCRRARRQVRVVAPPVQTDLLGLINRTDEQAYLKRQKLDVRQRDFDVARDNQTLVQNAVEHVNKSGRSRRDEARSLA